MFFRKIGTGCFPLIPDARKKYKSMYENQNRLIRAMNPNKLQNLIINI